MGQSQVLYFGGILLKIMPEYHFNVLLKRNSALYAKVFSPQ